MCFDRSHGLRGPASGMASRPRKREVSPRLEAPFSHEAGAVGCSAAPLVFRCLTPRWPNIMVGGVSCSQRDPLQSHLIARINSILIIGQARP
jgi:hypothetical protein